MYNKEDCGCGHHGEHYEKRHEDHEGDCGCGCRLHHGDMRFHRHFISREEMLNNLEVYLKQLQSEAKAVEERIAAMKKMGESQPS